MDSSEKFCLRWNDFESNISVAFRELREEKDFFDVTLACDDDNQIQAHKVILSACSPFFRNVLRRNPHQHPLLYLKGVKYRELLSVLNFMYMGEVNVAQEELNSFLTVAEELRVKGLTQNKPISAESKVSQTSQDKPKQVHRQPDPTPPPPPPKRSRVGPSTPAVVKKSLPAPSYSEVDNEVEEYIPVKTEPRDHPPHPTSHQTIPAPFQPQDEYQTQTQDQEMVQEAEHDQGTVALDEGYVVDESYDYQYAGEGYEDQNTAAATDVANKGKISLRLKEKKQIQKQQKQKEVKKKKPRIPIKGVGTGSQAWQCELCEKIFSSRKKAEEHIQDDHQ